MGSLVNEARKRGMRIMKDLVFNHSPSDHPFQDTMNGPVSQFGEYFVRADMKTIEQEGILEKEKTGDMDNIKLYEVRKRCTMPSFTVACLV